MRARLLLAMAAGVLGFGFSQPAAAGRALAHDPLDARRPSVRDQRLDDRGRPAADRGARRGRRRGARGALRRAVRPRRLHTRRRNRRRARGDGRPGARSRRDAGRDRCERHDHPRGWREAGVAFTPSSWSAPRRRFATGRRRSGTRRSPCSRAILRRRPRTAERTTTSPVRTRAPVTSTRRSTS